MDVLGTLLHSPYLKQKLKSSCGCLVGLWSMQAERSDSAALSKGCGKAPWLFHQTGKSTKRKSTQNKLKRYRVRKSGRYHLARGVPVTVLNWRVRVSPSLKLAVFPVLAGARGTQAARVFRAACVGAVLVGKSFPPLTEGLSLAGLGRVTGRARGAGRDRLDARVRFGLSTDWGQPITGSSYYRFTGIYSVVLKICVLLPQNMRASRPQNMRG